MSQIVEAFIILRQSYIITITYEKIMQLYGRFREYQNKPKHPEEEKKQQNNEPSTAGKPALSSPTEVINLNNKQQTRQYKTQHKTPTPNNMK